MSAPLKPTERIIWRDICRDYQGSYHSSPLSLLFHQDGKNFKDTNGEFGETFHSTTKTFEKLKVYVRNRNLSSDNALKTAHKSHSIFLALKMGSPSRSLEIRSPRSSPILTTTVTRKNCCLILSTLCRLQFWHFCKSGSTVPGYKKNTSSIVHLIQNLPNKKWLELKLAKVRNLEPGWFGSARRQSQNPNLAWEVKYFSFTKHMTENWKHLKKTSSQNQNIFFRKQKNGRRYNVWDGSIPLLFYWLV